MPDELLCMNEIVEWLLYSPIIAYQSSLAVRERAHYSPRQSHSNGLEPHSQ